VGEDGETAATSCWYNVCLLTTSAVVSSANRSRGREIVGRPGFSRMVEERMLSPRLSFLVNDRASVIFGSDERSMLDDRVDCIKCREFKEFKEVARMSTVRQTKNWRLNECGGFQMMKSGLGIGDQWSGVDKRKDGPCS